MVPALHCVISITMMTRAVNKQSKSLKDMYDCPASTFMDKRRKNSSIIPKIIQNITMLCDVFQVNFKVFKSGPLKYHLLLTDGYGVEYRRDNGKILEVIL